MKYFVAMCLLALPIAMSAAPSLQRQVSAMPSAAIS